MNEDPRRPVEPPPTEAHIPREADSTKARGENENSLGDTKGSVKDHSKIPDEIPSIPGYEILEFIARGGMGYVIKARHRTLDRLVAIKLPLPGRGVADDEDRGRFMREAHAAARLQHPQICPIYEVGEGREGQPYIVMGYIQGETLGDWAAHQQPTARETCALLAPLGRAVHYAHQHEVLHRDIKPSNIMVSREDGRAILMDFGLAKELTQERSDLTHTGQVMGTPAYMAPEQAAGNVERVGPQSDVYAIGAVLYHLITGHPPFTGPMGEILHKVQAESPVPPRKLQPRTHRDLETIILKAMAKEPTDRYESAAALADDLDRFCAGEAILARREGLLKKSIRHARRHPVAMVALIALIAIVVITGHLVVRERKIGQLRNTIQSEIDSGQFHRRDVERVEPLLDQLTSFDRQQGDSHRNRIYQLYAATIERLIRKPNLTSDDFAHIEDDLVFLETRQARLHASLCEMLERRLSQWQPLFELSAPFDNLDTALMSDDVRVEQNGLMSRGEVVVTHRACEGNVRLMARFDENWITAEKIGLYLGANASGDSVGYLFQVLPRTAAAEDSSAPSGGFVEVPQQHGSAVARMIRDGQLLREELIDVADGPLQLTISRRADQLVMQINDRTPIDFFDTFSPLGAEDRRFGIQWPVEVALVSLQASSLSVAQEASPLERGDDLYGRGQFTEALNEYEKQAVASAGTAYADQARLKQALCLVQLKRLDEAAERLEQLGVRENRHIRIYALGQLWAIRLEQNRYEDAHAVFESLSSQYSAKTLRPYIPATVTKAIIDHYHLLARGIHQFAFNPDLARRLHHAVAVEDFFGIQGATHDLTRVYLCRADFLAGRYDEALRMTEALLSDHPSVSPTNNEWWFMLVEEYCWLLRLRGEPERAVQQLNQRLLDTSANPRMEHLPLLVERARLHAALSDDAAAKEDLAKFHELAGKDGADYLYRAEAWLLEGFLIEREGDEAGAQMVWHKGLPSEQPDYSWFKRQNPIRFTYALMLASLTGEFSEKDVQWIMDKALPKLHALNYPAINAAMRNFLPEFTPAVISSIVGETWRRERGRKVARKFAFRDGPPMELIQDSAAAVFVEGTRQLVFGDVISDAQEEVLDRLAVDGYDAVFAGKLKRSQLLQLAFTWKGMTSFVGWEALAPELDPKLRGPLAYVFGIHYLKLDRPAEARMFFQTALKDAGDHAALRSLAQESLAELDIPKLK